MTQAQADPVSLFVVPWADITMVDAVEAVCALVEALIKTAIAK